ncbi:thioredoxin [Patescibacteria group bacterium]|nr:thioredoxin [Patescibacteria group bacterium]MDE1946283.1 thioredoxin [Patescibacteria group bacterium]MDE2010735.1 thioredoxin [Patescibacteria group bacterium]MDE2232619.1 thioredoxin [Patescibacteria group bacterium]
MSKIIDSNQSDFEVVVIKSNTPVLVDFWAPWCGPCRAMAPVLDELSDELDGKLKVVKVNVDEAQNQGLGMQYMIQSIPNMKIFKDGKVVHEVVGMRPKEMLKEELAPFLV